MLPKFQKTHSSIIAVQQVPLSETNKYGIVALAKAPGEPDRMSAIIEKPKPENAPSRLAAVGRYLLTPRIFHHLESLDLGAGGEIQLTDAIAKLLGEEKVYAHELVGERYDCGSKLGYLQATVAYALKHPEIAAEFKAHLNSLVTAEFVKPT